MPLPSINDVHVDGLRTEMSIAYMNERSSLAADLIAPILTVDKKSDKYAIWSKADFMRRQMRITADGDPAPIMSFGLDTSNSYICEPRKGKKFLSDESRANYDTPLNAERATVNFVTHQALIEREALVAANFWTTGVWGTDKTPGTLWSASSSDPFGDLRVGARTIKNNTGFWPNKLILGADVYDTLSDHADVLDRIKHTSRDVRLEELLASALRLDQVIVADAVYNSASAGATATMTTLYDTNDALLLYTPNSPTHDEPSAAYTFSWSQFDNVKDGSAAIKTWRSDDPDGEWFRGEMSFDAKVTASDCGYFFNEATS